MAVEVSCQEDLAPFRGSLPVVLVRLHSRAPGVQPNPKQTPLVDLPVVLVWPAQSL